MQNKQISTIDFNKFLKARFHWQQLQKQLNTDQYINILLTNIMTARNYEQGQVMCMINAYMRQSWRLGVATHIFWDGGPGGIVGSPW